MEATFAVVVLRHFLFEKVMSEKNYKYEKHDIKDFIPYINNSRTHSDEQIAQIASSIKEFGFTNPILIDEQCGIIAGHGRVLAAKKLSIDKLPCIVLKGLTEAQKKAYIIADNQLPLNAGWDLDKLKLELETLTELDFDIGLLGFDDDFLDDLLADEVIGLTDEDAVPEAPENPISVLGDIWQLGNHRLMCGDSTSIDSVKTLMYGNKADFGFCDPPYNLGFKYNTYDDNKSESEYIEFSNLWFSNLQSFTERQAITLGTKNISIMASMGDVSGVACWVKKNWVTSCKIAKLQQWEPIFFYGDYTKLKRSSDLYEINRVVQTDVGDSHTCPKQIALIEDVFIHYSIDSVLDLFQGSGTSIIACEKVKKKCYGMELDEKYVDVIIKRWQEFTGKDAVHIESGKTYQELKAAQDA